MVVSRVLKPRTEAVFGGELWSEGAWSRSCGPGLCSSSLTQMKGSSLGFGCGLEEGLDGAVDQGWLLHEAQELRRLYEKIEAHLL